MLSIIYLIIFILSVGMTVILVSKFGNRISVYYVLLYLTLVVATFGYMQLACAKDVNSAVYANQTIYLGAAFTPFFLLMCLADLCKVTIPKFYQRFSLVFAGVLFGFTSSVGSTPLYYQSVDIVRKYGATNLIKEYGPLHTMYPVYLLCVFIFGLAFIFQAFRRRRDISYITSSLLLVCMLITAGVYVLERSLHFYVELLPFTYLISEVVVVFLLRRISLYDIASVSMDSMVESNAYGFVLADSNGKFLGSEIAAKTWFPELAELPIDRVVKDENTDLLRQLGAWIRNEDERTTAYLNSRDCIIEITHTILKEGITKDIHCFYLRDDTKQQQLNKLMQQYSEQLEHDVNQKTRKLSRVQNDIIISMASIVENRDNNTGGHIARTSDVVRIFVEYLLEKNYFPQMTPEMANCIIKAAPLHDFGKIAIPDIILNKPGKFTDAEYNEMKLHSEKGAVIVERILRNSEDEQFRSIAINVAHYHHEKWDGNGYPDGLRGIKIPFEARVMALADVFDALVSKRVYKESFSYEKAFSIIKEDCGTHFDPDLCKAFLECRERFENLYDAYDD